MGGEGVWLRWAETIVRYPHAGVKNPYLFFRNHRQGKGGVVERRRREEYDGATGRKAAVVGWW